MAFAEGAPLGAEREYAAIRRTPIGFLSAWFDFWIGIGASVGRVAGAEPCTTRTGYFYQRSHIIRTFCGFTNSRHTYRYK
jgi:hypothetical protein